MHWQVANMYALWHAYGLHHHHQHCRSGAGEITVAPNPRAGFLRVHWLWCVWNFNAFSFEMHWLYFKTRWRYYWVTCGRSYFNVQTSRRLMFVMDGIFREYWALKLEISLIWSDWYILVCETEIKTQIKIMKITCHVIFVFVTLASSYDNLLY